MLDAEAVRVHNYLHLLAVALLYYDHALTLPREAARVWARPRGAHQAWFLLNRYFTALGSLPVTAMEFWPLSARGCVRYNAFRQWMIVGAQAIVSVIMMLRLYALYHRSRAILALLVGAGAALLAFACWGVVGNDRQPAPVPIAGAAGCHVPIPQASAVYLAMSWEALFAFDALVCGLTVWRTWRLGRRRLAVPVVLPVPVRDRAYGGDEGGGWRGVFRQGTGRRERERAERAERTQHRERTDIVHILLRDGALYFGVVALANLANLLTFYLADPLMKGALSTCASTLSVTMVSRLMLNLHDAVPAPAPGAAPAGLPLARRARRMGRKDKVAIATTSTETGTGSGTCTDMDSSEAETDEHDTSSPPTGHGRGRFWRWPRGRSASAPRAVGMGTDADAPWPLRASVLREQRDAHAQFTSRFEIGPEDMLVTQISRAGEFGAGEMWGEEYGADHGEGQGEREREVWGGRGKGDEEDLKGYEMRPVGLGARDLGGGDGDGGRGYG